jgi:flagellar biosynthesis protein FliQ/DNA-directed RNA polymerase subunit RPC12/RpoP
MAKKEYKCPHCNNINQLILMGDSSGTFEKICPSCNSKLEITLKNDKISVLILKEEKSENNLVQDTKIPNDYKRYKMEVPKNTMIPKIIAILILSSSIMGLLTGWSLVVGFNSNYDEYDDISLEIVVKNNTSDLENVTILFDNVEMNYEYYGNGTYNVMATPGKYVAKIMAPMHKNTSMEFFIAPQESNLRLPDTDEGIEGINRFTFIMEEGNGDVVLEENVYLKISSWCPNLIFLFSLIGIWGAWVTYTLQSYKNAQIGAFFSVLGMGFLIIGPILSIIALYYLKKHKNMFTASFKN